MFKHSNAPNWMNCDIYEDGSVICQVDPEQTQVSFFDYKMSEEENERRVVYIGEKSQLLPPKVRNQRTKIEQHMPFKLTEIESVQLE